MVASGHVSVIVSVRPERLTSLTLQSFLPPAGDSALSRQTREVRDPMPAGMPGMFMAVLTSQSSPVSAARANEATSAAASADVIAIENDLFIEFPLGADYRPTPPPAHDCLLLLTPLNVPRISQRYRAIE